MQDNHIVSTGDDTVACLKATELFKDSDEATLEEITAAIESVTLRKGEVLFREGDHADGMYIVQSGRLQAFTSRRGGIEVALGEIGEHCTVGEIQILAGGKRTAGIRALTDTRLAKLSQKSFDEITAKDPRIIHEMIQLTRRRLRRNELAMILTSVFGHMDEKILCLIESEMEWVRLEPGDCLFREGEAGDSLYIVVSGRLKAVAKDGEGRERTVGYILRGESVGEMAVFAETPRSATVYAMRESELAGLTRETLERILSKNPQVMLAITKIIIDRLRKTITSAMPETMGLNLALVAADSDVPLSDFVLRLTAAMSKYGETLHLNSERLNGVFETGGISDTAKDNPFHIRLSIWLDEQDARYRYVIYEADRPASNWTDRCIHRADRVMIVARSEDTPALGGSGALLRKRKEDDPSFHQTLVLLHPNGNTLPSGTKRWLDIGDFAEHHHVRWDHDEDFERLARFITGNAVGLVLGGGGARGFAHLGVVKAFRELGIPIDMVCGTSMGSIIAAFPAMQWNHETCLEKCKRSFIDINPLNDYTLPIVSIMRSRMLDNQLKNTFGDTQIEDLWINYFSVSSNLSTAEVVVSRRGPLWRAVRSSVSLPGIAVPVIHGNELLVDGGVLNNVPADIMRELCNGFVIAVDVGKERSMTIDMEEIPSPWKIFFNRLSPFKKIPPVPGMLQILGQTTLLGSINRAHTTMKDADLYLQPPVEQFSLLEWKSLMDIAETGYRYAKPEIENWLSCDPERKCRIMPVKA